jgi:capsid assembly protease
VSNNILIHIADRVLNRPLMITPEKLAIIAQVLEGRISIDASELVTESEASTEPSPHASRYVGNAEPSDPSNPKSARKPYRQANGVALIPVLGSLINRGSWMDAMSGITSYERLKYQISTAAADKSISRSC